MRLVLRESLGRSGLDYHNGVTLLIVVGDVLSQIFIETFSESSKLDVIFEASENVLLFSGLLRLRGFCF